MKIFLICLVAAVGFCAAANAQESGTKAAADFVTATPFKLPIATEFSNEDAAKAMSNALDAHAPSLDLKTPGISPGSIGSGMLSRIDLGAPKASTSEFGGNTPLDYGGADLPFSAARADLLSLPTNEQYPYRAAGKLFFLKDGHTYMCSASLVKKGLVVTAAHCVARFGTKKYYSNWQFAPGYREGIAPFGIWSVEKATVLTAYADGTDSCQQKGVICADDIAILVIKKKTDEQGKASYPGSSTGWFAIGWDKSGFAGGKITHVTQIGYPECLDGGSLMERNDSQGTMDNAHSGNTIIGSLMCGGSSGGPWLVNFGIQPALTGTTFGAAPTMNEVVGVTSWGSSESTVKWMGASPFLATNVVPLIQTACKEFSDACSD